MLRNMFGLTIPLLEKILRPIIVYVFLVIFLRIFGKRELAQLNPFDMVVLLSLSNTVQNAIIGEDNSVTGGLVGAFTLLTINYLVVRFLFGHRRLDEILEGKPTVLIQHGHVQEQNLAKEMLSKAELLAMAHRQGFKSLHDLETCVLDPGGTVFMEGKTPALSERHHAELLKRLDDLQCSLEEIKTQIGNTAT
ncbi:MAG: DUF421 domain-containing protein [Acidobacteria bacterium]|nr:DUF421 domain-containing protein [Acidobacteriota bacterium]